MEGRIKNDKHNYKIRLSLFLGNLRSILLIELKWIGINKEREGIAWES